MTTKTFNLYINHNYRHFTHEYITYIDKESEFIFKCLSSYIKCDGQIFIEKGKKILYVYPNV